MELNNGWVRRSESLPPKDKKVLWWDMMFSDIHIFSLEQYPDPDWDFTHWREYPEGPEWIRSDFFRD